MLRAGGVALRARRPCLLVALSRPRPRSALAVLIALAVVGGTVFAEAAGRRGSAVLPAAAPGGSAAPGGIVRFVRTDEKVVAFTFDDGPGPATGAVVDAFRAAGGRATFFVLGIQAERYPGLVARAAAAGDEIGNHTYSHAWASRLSAAQLASEIARTDAVVRGATGLTPRLFRFPGFISPPGLVERVRAMGYTVVGGSVDPRDWTRAATAQGVARHVLSHVFPGAIVVMHDGPDARTATLGALAVVLPELRAAGYRFVTVSELLSLGSR